VCVLAGAVSKQIHSQSPHVRREALGRRIYIHAAAQILASLNPLKLNQNDKLDFLLKALRVSRISTTLQRNIYSTFRKVSFGFNRIYYIERVESIRN